MNTAPCIFSPQGRLDASNAQAAEREVLALFANGGVSVVLDVSRLDYLSSAGLSVLLVATKTARSKGGRAVLVGAKPMVLEIFNMSGLDKIIPMTDNVESALTLLHSAS
jgi:stage II sporulation protein AA (anti-sigma F factor antagonist)